jgi:glucose-1-phosphate cytidylyltransferase
MKVVILCGGKGTRLREETEYRPKPMVPIGNRPILWHIMKLYATYGHKEFILCLGYKGDMIKDYFRNYAWESSDVTLTLGTRPTVEFHAEPEELDWKVTMVDTGEETMTGGRVRMIERFLGADEEFMLTYGDGVGNVNIDALLKAHRASSKTLTLTGVRPPGRFGELKIENGMVTHFFEKPQVTSGRINGGFFVARREVFKYLGGTSDLVFEREPLEALSREGQLACYPHDGFWQPMDTYQEYMLLNRLWAEGRAEWKIW